jgi:nucleoid-associated protein YgaU
MAFRRVSATTPAQTSKSSYARRVAATAAIAGAGIALPLMVAGTANAASTSTWDAVAQCESSGNWSIADGNGFYGGLQFTQSTWDAYGGDAYASSANLATPDQQIAIAENVLASQGPGAWPVCGPEAGLTQDSGTPSLDTSSSNSSSSGNSSASTGSGSSSGNSSSSSNSGSSSDDSSSSNSSTPAATTAPVASNSGGSSSSAGGSYTVVSGDTLSTIAQKEGVSSWQTLYDENVSVVGSNANLIFPGEVLTLG